MEYKRGFGQNSLHNLQVLINNLIRRESRELDKNITARKYFLFQELAGAFAFTLADGVILSGLLLKIGCPDYFIALIVITPVYTYLAQFFSPFFFERLIYRKVILNYFYVSGRLLRCLIIIVPFALAQHLWMPVIFIIYLMSSTMIALVSPIYNTLHFSILDEEAKYRYVAIKQSLTMGIMVISYLATGKILDITKQSYLSYLIIYFISVLLSVLSYIWMRKVKEPPNTVDVSRKIGIHLRNYTKPLRNKRYLKFIIFVLVFYSSLYMSSSYKAIFIMRYIGFSYYFFSVNESIVSIVVFFTGFFFTGFIRRVGWDRLLRLAVLIYALQLVILLTLYKNGAYILVLHSITAGVSSALFGIALMNYRFSMMPEQDRSYYESIYGVFFGFSALIPVFFGRILQNFFLNITNDNILSFRYTFAVSVFILIFSTLLIKKD